MLDPVRVWSIWKSLFHIRRCKGQIFSGFEGNLQIHSYKEVGLLCPLFNVFVDEGQRAAFTRSPLKLHDLKSHLITTELNPLQGLGGGHATR